MHGGGQGFDEDSLAVADRLGNVVQVGQRHSYALGHRSIVIEDSQDGPVGTMAWLTRAAGWTLVARPR